MATWKEVALIYGPEHIGKGVQRLLPELDSMLGFGAKPLLEKISTWIVIVATFLGPILAVKWSKLRSPWDLIVVGITGFLSTGLWDILEALFVPAAFSVRPYYPGVYSPTAYGTPMAPMAPAAAAPSYGKYRVTG